MSFSIATLKEYLRKQRTHIASTEGKTVKRVKHKCDLVAILWSDDTYTVLRANPGYGSDYADLEDVVIEENDTELENLAIEFELVSKEDIQTVRDQRKSQWAEQNRASKIAYFNQLKAELGL